MKIKVIAFVGVFFFYSNLVFSQTNNLLLGEWVLMEQTQNSLENNDFGYLKFRFLHNGSYYQSRSPFHRGELKTFFISEYKLHLQTTTFKINKLNKDTLQLLSYPDEISKYTYLRPKLNAPGNDSNDIHFKCDSLNIIVQKMESFNGESTYLTKTFGRPLRGCASRLSKYPQLIGDKNLISYIIEQLNYNNINFRKTSKHIYQISFEILETGRVDNVTVSDNSNKEKPNKMIEKIFTQKKFIWEPLSDNGINYRTQLEFVLTINLENN